MAVSSSALADALRDRYRIERQLGHGGMAMVYLARDLRHERLVALKVLRAELAHALGPERFLREIRIAAALQHPNILSVYDSGDSAGQLWFTMPYVEGESLRQRLTREPQLPLEEAVRIALAVAAALGYAHRRAIVHRDVKPENVLLSGDQCVLADFGVARALDAAGAERLTETGLALGTPAYMSPEQAAADSHLDARSDIYSLGCVLYEMLAGEPPFTGRTAQAIIARRLTDPVPPLRTIRDVPEQVEQVVTRALARSPADRFQDAPRFALALQAAAGAGAASGVRRPMQRRLKRRWKIATVLAVAGSLAALVLGLGVQRRSRLARPALDPNLLAVAPFDVLAPTLQLWHEGLGDVLSRTLEGAGPLRTVSPSVTLQRWQGRADRASAEALGRRTGAGLVVFGAVVPRARDSISLRASLLDGAGVKSETEVEVSGEAGRIGELADSLGIRILQALSRSRPIGSVRQVSMGSRSLPALKAFLQGEQFYRKGLWDSALTRYGQSVAADGNFALAYRRMAFVLGWNPASAPAYRSKEEYARRAMELNHGLSPRDSLLVSADWHNFVADQATTTRGFIEPRFRAMSTIEEAVRRYPEDPEAWYTLGEARFHNSLPLGTPPGRAYDAFSRSIALDAGFAPAFEHMVGLAVQLGHPDLARRHAAAYLSLDPTGQNAGDIGLAALMLDPSRAGAPETSRLIDSASVHTIFGAVFNILAAWPDSGETAIRLIRRIGEPGRRAGGDAPFVLDSVMWPQYLAVTLAARGHLREAYQADRRLLLHPDDSPNSAFLDPFLSLSLLGIVPDSVAAAAFRRSLEPATRWSNRFGFTPRSLRGLPWWLARRDTLSLARFVQRAGEAARRSAGPVITLRARLLGSTAAAYLALARGDSAGALRRLEAIPDTLCLVADFTQSCFHLNLTRARLLQVKGDYRQAGDLLERWRWDAGSDPMFVLATMDLARIAEHLGEREKAVEHYRFVADVWGHADPKLQPYVSEAREALVRLARTNQ